MCRAVTEGWQDAATCSNIAESRPPLKATQRREKAGSWLTGPSKSPGQSVSRAVLPPAFILGQALVPATYQLIQGQTAQLVNALTQSRFQGLGHFFRIAVGTTQRLGNHVVSNTQLFQALGGYAHGFRGLGGKFRALPQNGRTALRRDNRVSGVLQHVQRSEERRVGKECRSRFVTHVYRIRKKE